MKTTKTLQAEYDALIKEGNQCLAIIDKAKKAEERLNELRDNWHCKGLISIKKQELEDSKWPILEGDNRIISVDKKWITTKRDGINGATVRYKISNGSKERARDDSSSIDVSRALEIWAEWKNNG